MSDRGFSADLLRRWHFFPPTPRDDAQSWCHQGRHGPSVSLLARGFVQSVPPSGKNQQPENSLKLKLLVILVLVVGIFGGGGYAAYTLLYKPSRPQVKEKFAAPPPVPTPPPDPAAPELAKVAALRKDKKVEEARALLDSIVTNYPTSPRIDEARNQLGEINADLALSTAPSADKVEYVVKGGDSLDKIARQLKTSPELIMRSNNLANTVIQPGQRLLVFQPDFSLEIHVADKRVVLLQKNRFFKQYLARTLTAPGGARTAELKTRIAEKAAYRDGKRVSFGTKEYAGATRWITLAQPPGYTLYPETPPAPAGSAPGTAAAKPSTGLGLDPGDMDELHTLVSNGLPVTILP